MLRRKSGLAVRLLPEGLVLFVLGSLLVASAACEDRPKSEPYLAPVDSLEGRSAETPTDVAYRVLHAQRSRSVDTLVALLHRDALSEFKSMLAPAVTADTSGRMARELFGVEGAIEYEALEPREVFRRFLRNLYGQLPGLEGLLATLSGSVVGTVAEGDTLRHVVYRTTMGGEGMGLVQTQVLTLKLDQGAWRAVLPLELRRIGRLFTSGQVSGS